MGQKVHPTGARVGIIKDWNSKWYADSKDFANYLVEDQKIRKFLKKKLYTAGISKIEIERTAKMVKINLYTAKPGIIIGKGGAGVEALKAEVSKLIGKDVDEALAIMKFTPKASSEVLEKLLKSAIANAENNHDMKHENLYVAEIFANQGPTLKRIRPAAKGSAVRIRKRTSHITIVLRERV